MLKQQTRERLQSLVQNPKFEGSVHIKDAKYLHAFNNGVPTFLVEVNIHATGLSVFTLLAEEFPDMEVFNVKPYETDQGNYFTFGHCADGKIEEAEVNIWANYGERQKEKDPAPTESTEEVIQHNSITETSEGETVFMCDTDGYLSEGAEESV